MPVVQTRWLHAKLVGIFRPVVGRIDGHSGIFRPSTGGRQRAIVNLRLVTRDLNQVVTIVERGHASTAFGRVKNSRVEPDRKIFIVVVDKINGQTHADLLEIAHAREDPSLPPR